MSPRKERFRIPEWKVQLYKAENKKILFGPYSCPKCKLDRLELDIDKKKKEAIAKCECGFTYNFKYIALFEPVDYYNELMDKLNEQK